MSLQKKTKNHNFKPKILSNQDNHNIGAYFNNTSGDIEIYITNHFNYNGWNENPGEESDNFDESPELKKKLNNNKIQQKSTTNSTLEQNNNIKDTENDENLKLSPINALDFFCNKPTNIRPNTSRSLFTEISDISLTNIPSDDFESIHNKEDDQQLLDDHSLIEFFNEKSNSNSKILHRSFSFIRHQNLPNYRAIQFNSYSYNSFSYYSDDENKKQNDVTNFYSSYSSSYYSYYSDEKNQNQNDVTDSDSDSFIIILNKSNLSQPSNPKLYSTKKLNKPFSRLKVIPSSDYEYEYEEEEEEIKNQSKNFEVDNNNDNSVNSSSSNKSTTDEVNELKEFLNIIRNKYEQSKSKIKKIYDFRTAVRQFNSSIRHENSGYNISDILFQYLRKQYNIENKKEVFNIDHYETFRKEFEHLFYSATDKIEGDSDLDLDDDTEIDVPEVKYFARIAFGSLGILSLLSYFEEIEIEIESTHSGNTRFTNQRLNKYIDTDVDSQINLKNKIDSEL